MVSDNSVSVTSVTVEFLVDNATNWIKARRRRGETSVSPNRSDQDETLEERVARLEIRNIGWKLHAEGGLDLMHRTFDSVHDRYSSAAAERINIAWIGIHDWVS